MQRFQNLFINLIMSLVTQILSILLLLHFQHVSFPYLCLILPSAKIAAMAPGIMSSQQHPQQKEESCSLTNPLPTSIPFVKRQMLSQTTHWLRLGHMVTSLLCKGECNCNDQLRSFVLVSLGCCSRIAQIGWLGQQKFISHSMGD